MLDKLLCYQYDVSQVINIKSDVGQKHEWVKNLNFIGFVVVE